MSELRILFLGDVFGEPGLTALEQQVPALVARHDADLVVANGENAAGGLGLTAACVRRLLRAGVRVVTTGNHVWHKRELVPRIGDFPTLLRPANYPLSNPGRRFCVVEAGGARIAVFCLVGRVFMEAVDCPFQTAEALLAELAAEGGPDVVLVDFHAEATSEKRALGWFLDGRVSAVLGTHTHVATADAQVLPGGTGYMTDVGMTGPHHSVIGIPKEKAVQRFVTHMPQQPGVARGPGTVQGALLRVDGKSGRCLQVEPIEAGGPERGVR